MSESVEGQNELSMKFCGSWLHGAAILSILFLNLFSSITAPQDAHKRLVMQVSLGLNTSKFSAIRRKRIVSKLLRPDLLNLLLLEPGRSKFFRFR